MKFQCVNLRKKGQLSPTTFNNDAIDVENAYFFPASLTEEFGKLLMVLKQPYKKKDKLFLKLSWLKELKKTEEDGDCVERVNNYIKNLGLPLTLSDTFPNVQARLHKTSHMSGLYFYKDKAFSAEGVYLRKASDIEAIFCERVTSYTKTFDVTFVLKGNKFETHSCVDRKRMSTLSSWAKDNKVQFYQTGPDPLQWRVLFTHRRDKSWKEIYEMLTETHSESEEESEWENGHTDESDDSFSETDYPDEENLTDEIESENSDFDSSDEDEVFDVRGGSNKRVWYDSDDDEDYKPSNKKRKK